MEIRTTGADEYGRHLKVLVCGAAGAGKTPFGSTFPNPLYLAAEGGLMSVASRRMRYVEIKTSADMKEAGGYLRQPPEAREGIFGGPVDTVVVDTIDTIFKIYSHERMRSEKIEAFRQQDWGWIGEIFRALLRGLNGLDMNVVVCCHLKEGKDEVSGQMFESPALAGAVANEITWMFDLALLLRSRSETEFVGDIAVPKTIRYAQTYKDPRHEWIKDRSGKLPPEFPIDFETDYQRLSNFIFGGLDIAASESSQTMAPEPEPTPEPEPEVPTEEKSEVKIEVSTDSPEVVAEKVAEVLATAVKPAEEPAEEPAPDPKDTLKPADAPKGPWDCAVCGSSFDDFNQWELSTLLHQQPECNACYMNAAQNQGGNTDG